jgi:ABC-type oligopeptide transport system substrate-binding subunit
MVMKKIFLALTFLVTTVVSMSAACILRFKDAKGVTRYLYFSTVDCDFFTTEDGIARIGTLTNSGETYSGCTAARQGAGGGVDNTPVTPSWSSKDKLTYFFNEKKEIVATSPERFTQTTLSTGTK